MNVLVTLDHHYYPQLQVMLTSLKLNNPRTHVALYMIHNNFPGELLADLKMWCLSVDFDFIPIQIDGKLFQDAPVSKRYPIEMYYRLLAAHILPENVAQILYLDPDTLIINPIWQLWQKDLGENLFAAAAHTGKTDLANNVNRVRLGIENAYYNSGVLLMNLTRGRKEIVPAEVFSYIEKNRKDLVLPDQDLLNAMYGDSILPLDDALWNYDARNYNTYMMRSSGKYNLKWVIEHTSILHFCGKPKPWKQPYFYRFGMLYYHYEQLAKRSWETAAQSQ